MVIVVDGDLVLLELVVAVVVVRCFYAIKGFDLSLGVEVLAGEFVPAFETTVASGNSSPLLLLLIRLVLMLLGLLISLLLRLLISLLLRLLIP